jgi:hypothetical protein
LEQTSHGNYRHSLPADNISRHADKLDELCGIVDERIKLAVKPEYLPATAGSSAAISGSNPADGWHNIRYTAGNI